jgi:N-acetylmuramoyl-L-alanine amidase
MNKDWVGCASGNFHKGRRGFRPEAIVIHIMDGTLAGTDAWFKNPRSSVSAHYGVGKHGEIHQYVAETDSAFHAGTVDHPSWTGIKRSQQNPGGYINPNYYTIGIEHEGFATDQWPAAQIETSKALITEIAARWAIQLDEAHVIGHHQIRASKSCPGSVIRISQLLGSPQPATPFVSREVHVVVNANVRRGNPSTAAPIAQVLQANSKVRVVGLTRDGERIRGNSCWYQTDGGNYVWAGLTDAPDPE